MIKKLIGILFQQRGRQSLMEYVRFYSNTYPERIVFESPHRPKTSYRELEYMLCRAQTQLAQAGIQAQAKVALWINSSPEFAVASVALSDGAVCIPFSIHTTVHEAYNYFQYLGIEALLTDESEDSPLVLMASELGVKTIFIEVQHQKPSGTFEVVSVLDETKNTWPKASPSQTAFIFQTTGSTAKPKIVPITMEAICVAAKSMADLLKLGEGDTCLNFLPLHFIHGLVTSVYVPLLAGGKVVFPGTFEKHAFCTWLKVYNPTWFSASPAIYSDILKLSSDQQHQLGNTNLRFIRVGSAPISQEQAMKLERLFNVPLIEAYGMTETMVITCNAVDERKIGSVGKPLTSQVKILDANGQICKPRQIGSILVKGKTITKGYLNNPEANREVFQNSWFVTGDLGWMDAEGYLYLVGRTKEMINKGGQKIAPGEIEQALNSHNGIEESVVFAIPHPLLGEDVVAAVLLKPQHAYHQNELKRYMSRLLSPHKIPQRILVVESFPRSENGKILRQQVVAWAKRTIEETQASFTSSSLSREETYVQQYFSRVLKKDTIDVDEDFFALGGTSLDIAAFVSEMSDELGEEIKGRSLVEYPTIKSFASYLMHYHARALVQRLGKEDREDISDFSTKKENTVQDFSMQLIEQQRKLLQAWKGERLHPESLIVGRHTTGTKPPLFWCFNSAEDVDALSTVLGPDQPMYAMRSGHLLFKIKDEALIKGMAACYAREILTTYPEGPYILGGSCQAGHVAWHIAQELMTFGAKIDLLCLIDATIQQRYEGKVALFYAQESDYFNPFKDPHASSAWLDLYDEYTLDFLNIHHANFFAPQHIAEFASKLAHRLYGLPVSKME